MLMAKYHLRTYQRGSEWRFLPRMRMTIKEQVRRVLCTDYTKEPILLS
jgi:hypothetical protein